MIFRKMCPVRAPVHALCWCEASSGWNSSVNGDSAEWVSERRPRLSHDEKVTDTSRAPLGKVRAITFNACYLLLRVLVIAQRFCMCAQICKFSEKLPLLKFSLCCVSFCSINRAIIYFFRPKAIRIICFSLYLILK